MLSAVTMPVTAEVILEETSLKTGVRPTSVRASRSSLERPTSNWTLYFATGTPNLGERLFKESGRLVKFERRLRIAQCNRCRGHPPIKICSRAERYPRYGSLGHRADECKEKIPRCFNCHGPHSETGLSCMACPKRINGKLIQRIRDQLKVIREHGKKNRAATTRQHGAIQKTAEAASDSATPAFSTCP